MKETRRTLSTLAIAFNDWGIEMKREQRESQYFTENLADGITLDMVVIPEGTFSMGASKAEKGSFDYERPIHRVKIQPFFMGKYPVTQAQWRAIASLPQIERNLALEPSHFKGDDLPVENVSWDDALEFCSRISKRTGRTYRLPSEAEWEYACRAGTTTPFHFGLAITTDLANYNGNYPHALGEPKGKYRGRTTPVGSFLANAFGLYDMHGNVWEWCLDNWHGNYQGAPNDGSAWTQGGDGDRSPVRGGSWNHKPLYCRCALRLNNLKRRGYFDLSIGFRVACAGAEL